MPVMFECKLDFLLCLLFGLIDYFNNFLDLFITMYRQNDDNEESVKVFDFCLLRLELEMIKQTFDMTVALRLGGLSCDVMDPVSGVIRMLDTPMAAGELEYLLTVKFVNVSLSHCFRIIWIHNVFCLAT